MSLTSTLSSIIALQQQRGTKPLKYTSGGHDSRASCRINYSKNVVKPSNIAAIQSYNAPNFDVISKIVSYYQPPFHLVAKTNSPEKVTYTSSDTSILTVSGDIITYVYPGTAYVTVYLPPYITGQQFGNYYPVTRYTNITILPYPTTITFPDLTTTLSLNPISFLATSNSKSPIVYQSPDTFIAQFTRNNTITIFDEGQVPLIAKQEYYEFYEASSKAATLTILPADNVNIFRTDFYYYGLEEERSLYGYIVNTNQVVNNTDNSVLFTYKTNFPKSRIVQLKYICYLGDLVIQQFTDP